MNAEGRPTTKIYTIDMGGSLIRPRQLRFAVASDFSVFQVEKTTIPEAAYRLGADLVAIKEIVVGRGQERLLPHLETSPEVLVGTTIRGAIFAAEDPQLAADIARVYIIGLVETQDFDGVVSTLFDIRASKLPLPEYNQQFMVDLFYQAKDLQRTSSAYHIASRMVDSSERMVPDKVNTEAWGILEKQQFDTLVQEALHDPWDQRIWNVFERLQHRYHAYDGPPGETAQRVAIALIKSMVMGFQQSNPRDALMYALDSHITDQQIATISRKLLIEVKQERMKMSLRDFFSQVKDFSARVINNSQNI